MLNTTRSRTSHISLVPDYRELECVATFLRSERASICQLEPGRLYAAHESLSAGRLYFVRARFSHAVRLGVDRMNESYLVVPADRGTAPRLGGLEIPREGVALCHGTRRDEPTVPFELVMPESGTVLFVGLGRDMAGEMPWSRPARITAGPTVTILPGGARELCEIIGRSFRNATEERLSAHDENESRAIETQVLDVILRQIGPRESQGLSTSSSATRAVALIETLVTNFLATHEPASIGEMCRATGLSRRALTYAFQKRYGIPPKRFFRNLALNAVRHELIGSRGRARVSDIAPFYGFWHMSQFAADYKNQFGELPSETLARARWEGN